MILNCDDIFCDDAVMMGFMPKVMMGFMPKVMMGFMPKAKMGFSQFVMICYIAYITSIIYCCWLMLLFKTTVLISDVLVCDDFVVTEGYVLLRRFMPMRLW